MTGLQKTFEDLEIKRSTDFIVIHQCIMPETMQLILLQAKAKDVLFFDDCLYSQNLFLKENLDYLYEKKFQIILSLSTSLLRPDDLEPDLKIKDQAIIHKKINDEFWKSRKSNIPFKISKEDLRIFMSLSEIKDFLKKGIVLAAHGSKHLKLFEYKSSLGFIEQIVVFKEDIQECLNHLKNFGLETKTFVYPYGFESPIERKILKNFGFKYIFSDARRKYLFEK